MVPEIHGSYKLVIAEKPDAARRIANSLGRSLVKGYAGIEVLDVPLAFDGEHYVVCSAAGHLYGVGDPAKTRRIYPVFDIEWFSSDNLLSKMKWSAAERSKKYLGLAHQVSRRIGAISELANHADQLIQACDYDIEGETIGTNIINYACGNTENIKPTLRAKFSTLTDDEVKASFSDLREIDRSMVEAGRARHMIDFLWGINLSRAISESNRSAENEFRNLTIGRVQGPTLAFVVDREIEVDTHVPLPYWSIVAKLEKNGVKFLAQYEKDRIDVRKEAEEMYKEISRERVAKVESVKENITGEIPLYPFNIGDLQREAFRLYRFSPTLTLSLAEKLYLRALISYPRTDSQKLPPSIGYSKIISNLMRLNEYAIHSFQMEEGTRRRFPVQGYKEDPAHPAIYPTGLKPSLDLDQKERRIYDLIVLRFLAVFAENSISKQTKVGLVIGNCSFVSNGRAFLKLGWRSVYPFSTSGEFQLPDLAKAEEVSILSTDLESKFSRPPQLYTESSLLEKMESENIGTKATRAETISTLIGRQYILKSKRIALMASETGLVLLEALTENCSDIVSTDLTRKTEQEIERIVDGGGRAESLLSSTIHNVLKILEQIHRSEDEIGARLRTNTVIQTSLNEAKERPIAKEIWIGECPTCQNGELIVIRSSRTYKRFLGCTNYSSGCRTSAPLPQRGIIRRLGKLCATCRWPMISVRFSYRKRESWTTCPNILCAARGGKGMSKR